MALRKTEHLSEIFRLLSEQRELLKHLPYSSEQIRKDKEISARIRELIDQISEPSSQPERRLGEGTDGIASGRSLGPFE
jgi:hypothetical protein